MVLYNSIKVLQGGYKVGGQVCASEGLRNPRMFRGVVAQCYPCGQPAQGIDFLSKKCYSYTPYSLKYTKEVGRGSQRGLVIPMGVSQSELPGNVRMRWLR